MRKVFSYISLVLAAVSFLVSLQSCRSLVFENRIDCPSYLTVVLSQTEGVVSSDAVFTVRVIGDSKGYDEQLTGSRYSSPEGVTFGVTKGMASVGVIVGNERSTVNPDDSRIITPEGEMADPIYGFKDRLLCMEERVYDYVVLNKEHVNLYLILKNSDEMPSVQLELVCGWSGIDLMSQRPLAGDFHHVMEHVSGDNYFSRVTRQGDSEMHIDMWKVDSEGNREELVSMFPVGELALRQGFDWSKPSLDDLYITIDFARGDFTVSVTPWQDGWEREFDV